MDGGGFEKENLVMSLAMKARMGCCYGCQEINKRILVFLDGCKSPQVLEYNICQEFEEGTERQLRALW